MMKPPPASPFPQPSDIQRTKKTNSENGTLEQSQIEVQILWYVEEERREKLQKRKEENALCDEMEDP